jgi:hypothetical protein
MNFKSLTIMVLYLFLSQNIYPLDKQNRFYQFDNNINISSAIGNINSSYNYNDFIIGLNSNILTKSNWWLNLNIMSATNIQTKINGNSRIASSSLFTTKIGYSILHTDNINLMPYIGIEYLNSNQTFHAKSTPQDYYATTDYSITLGIHPEFIITNELKFSFDNNINYTQDDDILYNQNGNNLYHKNEYNYYYTINTDLQYRFNSNFNLGINYTNYINLNNAEAHKPTQYYGIFLGYNFG